MVRKSISPLEMKLFAVHLVRNNQWELILNYNQDTKLKSSSCMTSLGWVQGNLSKKEATIS